MTRIQPGVLVLAILLTSICVKLGFPVSPLIPGAGIWIATLWLWPRLNRIVAIQSSLVLLIGVAAYIVSAQRQPLGFSDFKSALEANYALLAMLIGVSFLRFVQNDGVIPQRTRGLKGQVQSMLGAHLLGSVLNLSILTLLGQRLAQEGVLSRIQGLALVRGFALASTWSPFFASLGVVLLAVPEAEYGEMIPYSIALVTVAGLITIMQMRRAPETPESAGFSLGLSSLKTPVTMAAIVLVAHGIWPNVPILTIVTITSVLVTLIAVFVRGGSELLTTSIQTHVQWQLPRLAGELALFSSSAVLGAGMSTLIRAYEISLPIAAFGAWEAFLSLWVLVGLAMLGLHPVAGIVLAGTLLTPLVSDATLLALVFAFTWALAVLFSPLSAAQLTLKLGFQVKSRDLARANLGFVLPIAATAYGLFWLRVTLTGG